jgi:aspartate-semialdehyde dehydrogenase
MAVTPIHRAKTVKRMVVSTYQAASGAGQAAMDELEAQTRAVLQGEDIPMKIFPFQYAFNLFSHNAPMKDNGYNEEVRLGGEYFCFPTLCTCVSQHEPSCYITWFLMA